MDVEAEAPVTKTLPELKAAFTSDATTAAEKIAAVMEMGELHATSGDADALVQLMADVRPFFATIPKAKTAKIVRSLMARVEATEGVDVALREKLCLECVEWCIATKRNYLRQRLQTSLCELYFIQRKYQQAIELIGTLLREVKKVDDKTLLVEINLIESRVHHSLRNMPKAKASLTSARTSSSAIYIAPAIAAAIDMQAGTLHADDGDFKTAYSYYFEAFEAFLTVSKTSSTAAPEAAKAKALATFKYMLLCKIMSGRPQDVHTIIAGKIGLVFAGTEDARALAAVADAYKKRSLQAFEKARAAYPTLLEDDPLMKRHMVKLNETMLEENLIRIIEPYSCVEIAKIATQIDLPITRVEAKLSQMILDKRFSGILDQGRGQLSLFGEDNADTSYTLGLGIIENMDKVMDALFDRATAIRQ